MMFGTLIVMTSLVTTFALVPFNLKPAPGFPEDEKYELCKAEFLKSKIPVIMMVDESHCLHYISCYIDAALNVRSYQRHCGIGLIFDPNINRCAVRWDNTVDRKNLCKHNENLCIGQPAGKKFPLVNGESGQCDHYFRCDGNDDAIFECCAKGYKFDVDDCVKDVNKTCKNRCDARYVQPNPDLNATTTMAPATPTCDKKEVPGSNGTRYTVDDGLLQILCPLGTKLDSSNDVCTCVHDPNFVRDQSACYLELDLDFVKKGHSTSRMYIDYHQVNVTDGIAVFGKKNSAISFPSFEYNDNLEDKFTMIVIFKSNIVDTRQSLLSTCFSLVNMEQPTLAIEITAQNKLRFSVDIKDQGVSDLVVDYVIQKGEWHYVRFLYQSSEMLAEVVPIANPASDPSKAKNKYSSDKNLALGAAGMNQLLVPGNGPLTLGKCKRGWDLGFNGEVDLLQVSFKFCNEENKAI